MIQGARAPPKTVLTQFSQYTCIPASVAQGLIFFKIFNELIQCSFSCDQTSLWKVQSIHDLLERVKSLTKKLLWKHYTINGLKSSLKKCLKKHLWITTKLGPRLHQNLTEELDESTARQQLKSPWSLSCRSIHLTLVTKWSWSWSWMNYCHPLCAKSIGPPILRYLLYSKFDHENPWSRSCVWSKEKVMFDLQNSKVKVMVKVKPIGHIWGLEFNRYACFSFHGNQTIFGWDIAHSIFDLENSRSRSWPRSNPLVTFEL